MSFRSSAYTYHPWAYSRLHRDRVQRSRNTRGRKSLQIQRGFRKKTLKAMYRWKRPPDRKSQSLYVQWNERLYTPSRAAVSAESPTASPRPCTYHHAAEYWTGEGSNPAVGYPKLIWTEFQYRSRGISSWHTLDTRQYDSHTLLEPGSSQSWSIARKACIKCSTHLQPHLYSNAKSAATLTLL